jgi:uncharacterized protein YecE (DUF72 family)
MTYVVVDTPPGTETSVPTVAAVTTPRLAMVRLHGRRTDTWGVREASVVEKYRYFYDQNELEEWLDIIEELAERAERVHVVFNNCYANYGVTNALELGAMVGGRTGGREDGRTGGRTGGQELETTRGQTRNPESDPSAMSFPTPPNLTSET